ncbi:N-acyl-D-aspartate/D-glutamate deacylase [Natronincola peptidivorans]|uniref:N-acyl-D-aspartate/D-glutamate deacylase n=1 Tax=Natronincola peptidivorans TaxID=426128 RepID=A0A1I0CCV2_9FIRM|nr:amidohydrolase family protein [Natronincola peptidivorans]SET17396.1 N-acyl-D-aspartate/D-glutamate deacylase [Natronincola peptidivorans]
MKDIIRKKESLVLMILFILAGIFHVFNQNVFEDGKLAIGPNIEENTSEVLDIVVLNDEVIMLVIEEDAKSLYKGSIDEDKIVELEPLEELQLLTTEDKNYKSIEINDKNNQLYVYGVKEDKTNFIEIYDMHSNEFVEEMLFAKDYQLSNIRYIDGYIEGMFYAKSNYRKQTAEIIMNTLAFDSKFELLVVELPSDEAYVSRIDITSDIEYILYTIHDKKNDRHATYIHDLTKNETILLEEISEEEIFTFADNKILSFPNTITIDTQASFEVNYKNKISMDEMKDSIEIVDSVVYDVVINNGIVIDPDEETMKFGYNIGIIDDKIESITKMKLNGNEEIDATHKIVSPGFIDILSFNPSLTAAMYKVSDGVTTNLSMHGCTVDFDGFFRAYRNNPTLVNYGGALFAIRLRYEAGLGHHDKASQSQIDYMVRRAREEIQKGAIGVAFSPEYYPGTSSEEIKAIMEVAKEFGIPTHFHGRYSSLSGENTGIDSVKEVLAYARELDAPVHFMHLHSTGGTGCMEEALELVEEARQEGYQVTFDIYPYDSWATNIAFERLNEGWKERFNITYSDIQVAGSTERLTAETFYRYRREGGLVIVHAMDEEEIIQALQVEHSMIGSDSATSNNNNHPRGVGTFSRFLGRYVRDLDIVPFMEGIKKMTILSAKHFEEFAPALRTRGRIQEGVHADITIFDYNKIIDTATAENSTSLSEGIEYVLVSGKVVLDENGVNTRVRNGQPIKGVFHQ